MPAHLPIGNVARAGACPSSRRAIALSPGRNGESAPLRSASGTRRPPDWERRKVRNDDSVVIELRIGDVSIVLPGDISAEVERELADRLERVPLPRAQGRPPRERQLQLGAHFSMPLRPSVALISCGRQNRFGHPAPAVLARYRERGVEVFRTDEDGRDHAADRRQGGRSGNVHRSSVAPSSADCFTSCHVASSSSSVFSCIRWPDAVIRRSTSVKRARNLSLARRSAASGSTPSFRDRLAIAKSRSPSSSSMRLVALVARVAQVTGS